MESRGSKHTLIVRKIEKEDFANYSCYATNTLGRAKAFVYLRGLYIMSLEVKHIVIFFVLLHYLN